MEYGMKRRTLIALLCAAALLVLTAVAATTQEREKRIPQIRARGVLLVGTTGDYRPMSFLDPDSGEYWGFDIELAKDLADALGVELRFVPTTWPTLMEDTLAGKFDLAISGITITEARRAQALMSDGYLANGKTVLCRTADAGKYTSLEAIDRPEVVVMENPGGLNEQFVRQNLPHAALVIHRVNDEIPGLVAAGEAEDPGGGLLRRAGQPLGRAAAAKALYPRRARRTDGAGLGGSARFRQQLSGLGARKRPA